jgi:hypothetical protein
MISRAALVMGLDSTTGQVRTSTITELVNDGFQADRMYPPIPYRAVVGTQYLVDWQDGVQGRNRTLPPNAPPALAAQFKPGLTQLPTDRPMDPWIVVTDWRTNTAGETATQECFYRDFWRTVISRKDSAGVTERLFMDSKTGFPVKLDRRERHYLWGDRMTEYVWTTWLKFGHSAAPRSAFMVTDGETERAWTHANYALVPRDSISVPLTLSGPPAPPPGAARADAVPDTIRIAPNTVMLTTAAYNNVVTLQHDTVFILDAQLGEARARADSVWIGKLFPGKHPLVLVVTDLAWPHIAGVRYWIATGVPVITHTASVDFLNQVVRRRWTLEPDLLERKRNTIHPVIRGIDSPLNLARGAVKLAPIDGIASEGALMAYLPGERTLYVGDYIQPGTYGPPRPGLLRFTYLDEVMWAARKVGFDPVTFAAMHVKPTAWSEALNTH